MTLAAGTRLGAYEITGPLGAGGMGEVYRAKDTRLGREVAIKVLPAELAGDPERRRRFEQEARAVSALSHSGIVTLFEIESARDPGSQDSIDFLVMELVPGEPLQRRIPPGGLPILEAVDLALQAADAIAAAHAAGVVHRDLKPANLMVTPAGQLKILDFGLARLHPVAHTDPDAPTLAQSAITSEGSILGTMGYLAPEQAAGERADARCDLFSFGVVLYQMLSGISPFTRDSPMRSLAAVLHESAPPLEQWRDDVPPALRELVTRCLEKDPARRPQSAREVSAALAALRASLVPAAANQGRWRGVAIGVGAAAALALALGGWFWWRGADERWLEETRSEIEALLREDRRFAAYVLALEAERRFPEDAALARLLPSLTFPASFESEPEGAVVTVADYRDPGGLDRGAVHLGQTPILRTLIPDVPIRVRVEKAGFATIESAPSGDLLDNGAMRFRFPMTPAADVPSGMVRVGGGVSGFRVQPVEVAAFWIDRLEVSNRDFQRFVDAGGYERREWWREAFIDGDRKLSWEEAKARLRDRTGRLGPATWELGRYPERSGDLPVGGVSWFEAMAYAAWAGKSLPTYHHWYLAASPDIFSEIVELSNFAGAGPRPVGSGSGLGPWGTLDMAGNVKEWTATESSGLRYQPGGGFGDAGYLYAEAERAAPFAREPSFGFRCARFDGLLPAELAAPVERTTRDLARERPVDDAVFRALISTFAYDRAAPLDPRVEEGGEEVADWRVEKVSVAGAHGSERLPIRLYLPKRGRPPYSSVVFFPDSTAETKGLSERLEERYIEFLVRSGRAVVFPVFANTYERRQFGWTAHQKVRRRDLAIAWSKEVSRTLDYLETRDDLDAERVALYGFSLGAIYLPVFAALEPRFATGIALGGGVSQNPVFPENDALNFAPRVRIPILMIAGRDDFLRPVETLQRPLFDRLGTPSEHKRFAVLDGGHVPTRMHEIVREILDWLDRWLGPVATA